MTSLFTQVWLLLGLCLPFWGIAQAINLPSIQSQYLYQATNKGAPILKIAYQEGKAQLHSPEGLVAFSQENLTTLLADHHRTHSPARKLLAAAVRLQAPANLPIHYLNDLFFWLRIGGCNTLYLGVIEASQTNTVQYLSLPIAPFIFDEKIYKDVAAAQKVHPNTSFLDASFDWNWYFEQIKNQPIAYVPSLVHPVVWVANQVSFQEELCACEESQAVKVGQAAACFLSSPDDRFSWHCALGRPVPTEVMFLPPLALRPRALHLLLVLLRQGAASEWDAPIHPIGSKCTCLYEKV